MLLISCELRTAQQVSLARQNYERLSRFDIKKIWSKLTTFTGERGLCWKHDELAHSSGRFGADCGHSLSWRACNGGNREFAAERRTSREQPSSEKSRTCPG